MAPTALVKLSHYGQLSQEPSKLLSQLDMPKNQWGTHSLQGGEEQNKHMCALTTTIRVSLLTALRARAACGSAEPAVLLLKPQWLYHLATSCSSLILKCGVLNGLRALQKKIREQVKHSNKWYTLQISSLLILINLRASSKPCHSDYARKEK